VTKKSIFVVEDEEDILELIRHHLTREGYTVITARNGEEAVQAIARKATDLILLDLMLPGLDGLEVCRTLNLNDAAAREVCAADTEIDAINRDIFQQVKRMVTQIPGLFEPLLQIMHIARHLERIADHATHLAEDLIDLIEGRIVRHTQEVSARAAQG
jgi:CheY-like chemotaxis protein